MYLDQAMNSDNAEMTKRLKYTKDILTHMLNNNPKPMTSSQSKRAETATSGGIGGGGLTATTSGAQANAD